MKETVIVTGADGFVGAHLVRSLAEQDVSVIAVDLNRKRLSDFKDKHLTFLETDFTDINSLKDIVDRVENGCYLIHLGGYVLGSSKEMVDDAVKRSIAVNISGSYNLIKGLKPKLTGVCFASTLDVYGQPRQLPITESHPVEPNTFYAASKLSAEQYITLLLKDSVPLSILRFSHIYGQGNLHSKALTSFMRAVKAEENPVIYGDGSDLRDYIHVKDIVAVIGKVFRQKNKGMFNVASGRSFSLRQLAELAIKISGKNLSIEYKERQKDKWDYVFDNSKFKNEIGYVSQMVIEEGIKELLNLNGCACK
ncbi:MAG: SDR family NAD(P)-dependent oxidoreductase [Candidatus Omnitrophota bacterium]|nr:SDR family NAD(P)-dependent oxidoreductase [Candidatus Omnitrophota bacterium]